MPSSGRKRVLIGVMSSKLYLPKRGKAIKSSWMNEIDYRLADVKFFADYTEGYSTVQVKKTVPYSVNKTVHEIPADFLSNFT